jgi:ATP-dependent Clp protease protease subunit
VAYDISEPLLANRRIYLFGELDHVSEQWISAALVRLFNVSSQEEITLYIDSNGGNHFAERNLCDVISALPAPVVGLVTGEASSAAFGVLQACKRRVALPRATLMNHGPIANGIRIDSDNFITEVEELRRQFDLFLDSLAVRCKGKCTKSDLQKWAREEMHFEAHEALQVGLLDHVIDKLPA